MTKYKVVLDHGDNRKIECDIVSIDPHWVKFHSRASAGNPEVLKAVFPANKIVEIIAE